MPIKSFEIDYNGRKETIEYETRIPYGDLDKVLRATVNAKNPIEPTVDLHEYRIQILQQVLRKAPFDYKNIGELKKQDWTVIDEIQKHVMKEYGMTSFLEGLTQSLLGSDLMKNLDLASTLSAQQSSDGQKPKSTNTKQNSSQASSPSVNKPK